MQGEFLHLASLCNAKFFVYVMRACARSDEGVLQGGGVVLTKAERPLVPCVGLLTIYNLEDHQESSRIIKIQ